MAAEVSPPGSSWKRDFTTPTVSCIPMSKSTQVLRTREGGELISFTTKQRAEQRIDSRFFGRGPQNFPSDHFMIKSVFELNLQVRHLLNSQGSRLRGSYYV